jgi:hypothetical protein
MKQNIVEYIVAQEGRNVDRKEKTTEKPQWGEMLSLYIQYILTFRPAGAFWID